MDIDEERELRNLVNEEVRYHNFRQGMLPTFRPPKLFSGALGEHFTEWHEGFKRYLTIQGVKSEDEELQKMYLEYHLTGPALGVIENFKTINLRPRYVQYVNELLRVFPDSRDADLQQRLLMEHRQHRTESVVEYFTQMKHLAKLAFPGMHINHRDEVVKSFRRSSFPN